jgi:hypothetical protein
VDLTVAHHTELPERGGQRSAALAGALHLAHEDGHEAATAEVRPAALDL